MLQEVGKQFGRMMYLLDSFEDYKWDTRAKRFNALHSAFPQHHNAPSQRAHVVKRLFDATFLELKTHISNLKLLQKVPNNSIIAIHFTTVSLARFLPLLIDKYLYFLRIVQES